MAVVLHFLKCYASVVNLVSELIFPDDGVILLRWNLCLLFVVDKDVLANVILRGAYID